MTITVVNAHNLRLVESEVRAALAAVEARLGIKFTYKKGVYDNGQTGELRYSFAVVDTKTGEVGLDAKTKWALKQYGLTDQYVEWPGKQGRWKIVGYNSRAHTYPINVKPEFPHHRGFRIPLSTAQRYFKAQVAPVAARTYESQF